MRNLTMFGLLVAVIMVAVNAEVFTSMANMEALLQSETQITSIIDQYIEMEKNRLQKLKDFAAEYEKHNRAALKDGSKYIANPVNAFLLIKRLTSDWSYVESLMKNNLADEFLANITGQRADKQLKFPTNDDMTGAAVALMRLQDTYRLSTADIASGKIQGVKRADELTAADCFELGRTAYNQADYYHTLMWMQEAVNRLEHEDPKTVNEADVLEYLAYALYQQGNLKRALVMTKRLYKIAPDHPRAEGNVKWYEDMLTEQGQGKMIDNSVIPPLVNERPQEAYGNAKEREDYEALCRGEVLQSPKTLSKLYCYLKRDRPYLKLAPIKVEILRFKPLAVLFKEVISDDEMATIKELAYPRLNRATVHNRDTGKLEFASYRISKSAWLKHHDHPVVARINNRIDMMTNLNQETSEDLQIANYGLGGHYDPHYDFARKEEKNAFKSLGTGNRIATVLFYMSQPEAGGATVFVELKTAVFPSKGDALFWYNLQRNGDGDMTTRHAACPVLAGVKWVSNKWIHERGQEFRRPCAATYSKNEEFVGEL